MMNHRLKVALVQEAWHEDPLKHKNNLARGIREAAAKGASLVCLAELTLSPYFCTRADLDPYFFDETLLKGKTVEFIAEMAKLYRVHITASLFETPCFNTAIAMDPQGQLIGKTRKQHIPYGEKYHEDFYFQPGDSDYPLHTILDHQFGLPTCYDQWFPELSRIYGLKGAEILVYPTAIGSEPRAPSFDTEPLWEKVIIAQGIMANTFMIVVNRIGCEDGLSFYGSSFISSPLGEILAKAPRDEPAVLVAELDFNQRELWAELFPFTSQRQPWSYQRLVQP